MIVVSTSRFTFTNGLFVAEASDLRELDGQQEFMLVSARSADRIRFVYQGPIRDCENELVATRFVPAPGESAVGEVHILDD